MPYHWSTPVRYIKGLGPQRSRELNKLGIETVGNLLERQPLSYIFPGVTSIEDARDGPVVIKAKVVEIGRSWDPTVRALLEDDTGVCKAQWYHGAWTLDNLRPGMNVTFWGKMSGGTLQQPKWCTHDGGMESVYGGQYGKHHNTIRAALVEVLANVELPDTWNGHSRVAAYQIFHFPDSKTQQQWCLKNIKFDEAIQLALALQERRRGRSVKGVVIEI